MTAAGAPARIAYFDCFAGASGDMILGALLDLGVELAALQAELDKLHLPGWRLERTQVRRGPIVATLAHVAVEPGAPHRNLQDIRTLLDRSDLPPHITRPARAIFEHLAQAEAKIHNRPVEAIHFHEVGAVDAIIDVVGAVIGLALLGVERIYCAPLPAGGGFVRTAHGLLPVPAPATLELIARAGASLAPTPPGAQHEMVTPTGAAILTALATFAQPPARLVRVGYGAGSRDLPELPNVLRVWLGEPLAPLATRTLALLETNLDDLNPEIVPYLIERLLAAGARDAWLTPIQMKKGRPAFQLSALAEPAQTTDLVTLLLRESSTLGVRVHTVERYEAAREQQTVTTPIGPARIKIRRDASGKVTGLAPEYEDCRALATQSGQPLLDVYRLVATAGWQQIGPSEPTQ